ncbi:MAG: radical SAM protein [Thermodesulfobacteriota bacterium]
MTETATPVHPLGRKAKILLSSVFGPYAQDDAYGSRKINPMELYHNQVTRAQGAFSLRMFHRSFGLMLLQANIEAPCTLLDFPTLERFTEELKQNTYDIVGISAILVNTAKVKKMCELIRKHLPRAVIVIGGHIANRPDLSKIVDADHIVKGDGVRWFRKFLAQDPKAPVRHPLVYSGFGTRGLGVSFSDRPGSTAAILIPSVGCPLGCNFCSTSAMFGGKGHFINFYETGDELFTVMRRIESELKVRSFFVMDENFLFHRQRALRLLELMKQHDKSWSLYVFSSARVLQSYSIEELVGLGISWVWMGLEGEDSRYAKLRNVDTHVLVKTLQSHGIRVLGSSIIGLENHTPRNIDRIIDYAVSHDTVFHQFMLYTPVAGTPLYEAHRREGTLFSESEFPLADAHGQYRFNYRHPHFSSGREEQVLLSAFQRDFEVNGPSLARLISTTLTGWQRYKNHPDTRIRKRFGAKVNLLRTAYSAAVWAMNKYYRGSGAMETKLSDLLKRLNTEFGWKTRLFSAVAGRFIYAMLKREEKRLARGWSYEPGSFYEKNAAAMALESKVLKHSQAVTGCVRWVTAKLSPFPG